MLRTHKCPDCGKWFILTGKPAEYYDDMMFHAPKLNLVCGHCGTLFYLRNKQDDPSSGRLLAVQGADYIEDFGEF